MTNPSRRIAPLLLLLACRAGMAPALFSSPLLGGGGPSQNGASPSPASVSDTPVVVCPGFGNDEIDYVEPLSQPRDAGLVSALERRGFDPDLIRVVPVRRGDWLRVAGGLLDPAFYAGRAMPSGFGYGWYLDRLRRTVDRVHEESGGRRALLLGHSAGGWLARAAMGDGFWRAAAPAASGSTTAADEVRTADRVCCLVTVGAIHRPPAESGSCVTRGALEYTDREYPGAHLAGEGVGYVSVGGDAIVGDNTVAPRSDPSEADELYSARGEGSASRVAYTSYRAVCGRGDVSGDGVVPIDWALLDGSRQIRLEGVLHSINEAGTTIPTDRWYGSEGVIDRWLPAALEEAGIGTAGVGSGGMAGFGGLARWAEERAAAAQRVLQL